MRLTRGGPWVPASIQWEQTAHEPGEASNKMERSPILTARINGEPVPMDAVWLRRGRAVTKAEHDFQVADGDWARQHRPDDPKADPGKRIELDALPPVYGLRR